VSDVVLCECFARDGLQHEERFVPTETKIRLIEQFARLGFQRVEATSYASPDVIPQFRDARDVVDALPRRDGVCYKATCPNAHAVERALADLARGSGVDEISLLVSASESHSLRNLRRSRRDQWANVLAIVDKARGRFRLVGTVSVAFGCPFEGSVNPDEVLRDVATFADCGVTHVALGDTVGLATPRSVRAMIDRIARECPRTTLIAHFHDTRGRGLANCVAAFEAGVTHFDTAFGGVGGHPPAIPYGEGHTGNVCTEDWVDLLESMGVSTGIDPGGLMAVARECERALGRELSGRVTRSGLRPTPATSRDTRSPGAWATVEAERKS
jgi:hydroxymethylglutaryl-CoA lyase